MSTDPLQGLDRACHKLLAGDDWSLCVGAGICTGIMPDWALLTRQILGLAYGTTVSEEDLKGLSKEFGWGFDAFLQSALNQYLLSARSWDKFNSDLAEELYRSLLRAAATKGLESALRDFLSDPFRRDNSQVLPLEEFLSSSYGPTSVMQIARLLLQAKHKAHTPTAVLTFNADVLLHAALTLLEIRNSHLSGGTLSPNFSYRGVHHSVERAHGKTPIYHIHGSITPSSGQREARERLIFSESSYLRLAGSVYTWPQTVFLSTAQASRIVFVGLSMSDPNIRRWLSWCDRERRDEIAQINKGKDLDFSSQHLWITTPSADSNIQRIKETGLLHLGVRTVFIPSWEKLEAALSNLLGIWNPADPWPTAASS